MIGHVLAIVAMLAVISAGGTVWLLVRDERGHSRSSSARLLRRATAVSAVVVLATVSFLRPWYWAVVLGAAVMAAFAGVRVMLRVLERRASPAGWGAIALAMAAVVVASGIVTLGGTAAVLDGAALVGGRAEPVAHDGQVLAHPVLYQVFWGPGWDRNGPTPALVQAAEFQRALSTSPWSSAVVGARFGVGPLHAGGCWVDPRVPASTGPVTSTSTGPFPDELRRVFAGRAPLVPCPGLPATSVPTTIPPDALVAVWVSPDIGYGLGGVSAHGAVPWPGRPEGLAAAGLTGGFARWGRASCPRSSACRSLPGFASPSYALSHELVETVTNPYGHGWFADVPLQWSARYFLSHGPTSLLGTAPAFEGEVADLCEPGQPGAPRHKPIATNGKDHLPVADFYRPGTGCVA